MEVLGLSDCEEVGNIGDIKLGGGVTKEMLNTRLKEINRILVIEQEKNQELDENIKSLNEAVTSWKELCVNTEKEVKSWKRYSNEADEEIKELNTRLNKSRNETLEANGKIEETLEELQEERELSDHKTVEISELKENNKELKKLISRINKLVI